MRTGLESQKGENVYLLKEAGVQVRRVPNRFLLGSLFHVGGLQDLPDPRNQILEQLLLSPALQCQDFTEGGEGPEHKNSALPGRLCQGEGKL